MPIPNARIANPQGFNSKFPMLGLPIPNGLEFPIPPLFFFFFFSKAEIHLCAARCSRPRQEENRSKQEGDGHYEKQ